MRLKRFFWIAPTTVLLIVSQAFRLNFPVPLAVSPVVAQTFSAQAQTAQNRKDEAQRLYQRGMAQFNKGQFREALEAFQQVLDVYRSLGEHQAEAATLSHIGSANLNLGQYQQALESYQKALIIVQEIGDRKGEGAILSGMGLVGCQGSFDKLNRSGYPNGEPLTDAKG